MRVRFLDIDGQRTRLLYAGSGPAVVLLHGLGTTAERWYRNIDALAGNFSVYAPDLLNHGFSGDVRFGGEAPQSIHVAQIRGLVRELGLPAVSVIGSSYGGLVAALLALKDAASVKRLVIVGSGSATHPPDEQAAVLRAARENSLKALTDGSFAAARQRLQKLAHDPSSIAEEALPILITANAQPGRQEAAMDLYDSLIASANTPSVQAYPRLEEIQQPTMMIVGRNDIRASWQRAQEASARIPNCKLSIYDACGHAPMQEHAERFNADLRAFLNAEDPRGST